MSGLAQVESLLRQHGYVLARHKKHQIYRNQNGRIFVMASTPSDVHSYRNALRQLHRMVSR